VALFALTLAAVALGLEPLVASVVALVLRFRRSRGGRAPAHEVVRSAAALSG